jgi:hypothetical protein
VRKRYDKAQQGTISTEGTRKQEEETFGLWAWEAQPSLPGAENWRIPRLCSYLKTELSIPLTLYLYT